MNKAFYIKTFGCQMNERDSEIMAQLLAGEGYAPTEAAEQADLILINTCSIRDKAEQKVYSLLGQLRDHKIKNPGLRIGVTGCVAQQEGNRLFERMPHVDMVIGTQQIHRLPQLLQASAAGTLIKKALLDLDGGQEILPFPHLSQASKVEGDTNIARGACSRFVTIMQGCDNFCSYCVVPSTRGRERSRPLAHILEEVELLVAHGVREITLLGQNVNSYSSGATSAAKAISFAQLLHQVATAPGLLRLRFTTSHPKDLSLELMRCFEQIDILCPHFHLPVQSGSDQVLARMNRKYTVAEYLKKVETLRRIRPDIALATDFIVGFPGETDEDFEATLAVLEHVRFHSSFSFKYSDRPQTASAAFDGKVAEAVKTERLHRLQQRQNQISLERNQELFDKDVEVMIESIQPGQAKGRSAANQIVHFPVAAPLNVGELKMVRIQHAGPHSLRGQLVE